jgi:hypothetical protein
MGSVLAVAPSRWDSSLACASECPIPSVLNLSSLQTYCRPTVLPLVAFAHAMDNTTGTGASIADPEFPITIAQLIGNFCEVLTYGIYLVTCTFCAKVLLMNQDGHWKRPHEIRWHILAAGIILFVVSTLDVVTGLMHNINAFVDYHGEGGPRQELTKMKDWINVSRVSLFASCLTFTIF